MKQHQDFTQGPILPVLLRFALPVLLALLLQAMYGAVDLQVVGRFGTAADISAVSTGSQIMHTVTTVITGLAMGVTVLLIEQNANMALKIADVGYVLETGRITLTGSGQELLRNEDVKKAYLGS